MLRFCPDPLDAPPHQNRDFGGTALILSRLVLTSRPVVAMVLVSPVSILAESFCPFGACLLYVSQVILVILPHVCECMCMQAVQQLRESLTFFRIAIWTLVQAGANAGKQRLSRGSSLLNTNNVKMRVRVPISIPGARFWF